MLRDQLSSHIHSSNISANAAARMIGISPAALSQWIAGKYAGNNQAVEEKVQAWMNRQAEKRRQKSFKQEFCRTSVARRIFSAARMAHLEGEMCVCVGEAGYGKTVAVKKYQAENPGSILVEADYGYTTKVLFSELHRAIGRSGKGTIHDMSLDLIDHLRGTERLIIIDEAEHLPYRALEMLRRLHDKAGIGVLLCGMPRLIENIRGRRGDYAQLHSRIGGFLKLREISQDDAKLIIESYIPGANGLSAAFYRNCRQNARTLNKLIRRTVRAAENNNAQIDEAMIKSTAKMLLA